MQDMSQNHRNQDLTPKTARNLTPNSNLKYSEMSDIFPKKLRHPTIHFPFVFDQRPGLHLDVHRKPHLRLLSHVGHLQAPMLWKGLGGWAIEHSGGKLDFYR